ncbi:uncharacterized protein LOC132266118 [Phlebotomus argentipes]|uniref:uncharacterized protein LOC132266118 n=1 Tax=Phlebotomus argentipes TaxID=94469 RepID=UPI0028932356|nr:uncharacterized protein LOC132266118 [Phlebotomus argentipes]XP_059622956.1 uncharacterized protein LOC132266118 [Phlebotomus argentipes]
MNLIFVIVSLCGYYFQVIDSLKLVKVTIPSYKLRGENVVLECQFELQEVTRRHPGHHFHEYDDEVADDGGRESLYSVKWYKDNEEFYRFVPRASPPQHSYKVDGIRVAHEHSNSSRVSLRNVNIKSSGLYRCEVSGEAPNFSSVQGEGYMEIVYLPRDGPHIIGEDRPYEIGEYLNFTCTSGKSHPGSVLQWYINDDPVVNPESLIHYPPQHHVHGLITSRLGLNLQLEGRHFRHSSALVLRCVANILPHTTLDTDMDLQSVVQRWQPLIENREALFLVRSASNTHVASITILGLILIHQTFAIYSHSGRALL